MLTFTVNEFLRLELDGSRTEIYINDKFKHFCKHLIISIPTDRIEDWEGYESMDEIIKATRNLTGHSQATSITPEEAFWGHCSNLQAWADHGYDYRLLDTQLSIPIILDILKALVKERNRPKFRRFFHDIINSLDDYTKNSRQTITTWDGDVIPNPALYSKFKFLKKIIFRERDKYFTDEEISGSVILSGLYNDNREDYLKQKEKRKLIANFGRWERKLFPREPVVEKEGRFGYFVGDRKFNIESQAEAYAKAKNLEYRRFLRSIRDATDEHTRNLLAVSDRRDYLPYLYATGKFTKEKNISFLQIDNDIYIRDSDGRYWRTGY